MPWVTEEKSELCIVCKGATGHWISVDRKTVWVKCIACDGQGRIIVRKSVWKTDDNEKQT